MAGDTIATFFGEFLMQPTPLECSFNYCSHNCAYCFANLNKPDRSANIGATERLLEDFPNRKTLEATLLQQGYGILISNRVDPFAASNYREAVPIMRRMTELNIPIALQTKGGKGVDESLSFLKPSCWYVTITMLDEDLRRQIEPGATSIASRFELIEKLTALGHVVFVGLNPWCAEWCSLEQAQALLHRAKDCGAYGVWTEVLHFNWRQIRNMPERDKAAIGKDAIKRASKRNYDPTELAQWLELQEAARAIGLEVFSMYQGERSDYFEPYKRLYPKSFETLQGFVNRCHDTELGRRLISFEDFASFILPTLPEGVLKIGHYIGATAHAFCKKENWTNWMTYRELLKLLWQNPKLKGSPLRCPAFAYARHNNVVLQDSENLPYLAFNENGFNNYYTETDHGGWK